MTPFRQAIKRMLSRVLPPQQFLLRGDPGSSVAITGHEPTPISLTFDDGPDPQWTPAVLEALDEAGWTGTFFLIGRKAEAHSDLVREILDRGHEIGNHSYAHREPTEIGVREFINGVLRTQEVLSTLAGEDVAMMRPPKGRLDVGKTLALWRARQSVVLWNVDPRDYQMTNSAGAQSWAQAYQPSAGDIVLLHDDVSFASEIVRTLAAKHGNEIQSVGVSHWLDWSPSGVQDRAKQLIGSVVVS